MVLAYKDKLNEERLKEIIENLVPILDEFIRKMGEIKHKYSNTPAEFSFSMTSTLACLIDTIVKENPYELLIEIGHKIMNIRAIPVLNNKEINILYNEGGDKNDK